MNLIPKTFFHSSSFELSRYPALATKITRYSHVQNLRKIEQLKNKLGKDYRDIGRSKRQSPYSERNSPSKPTQPPAPIPKKKVVSPFLMSLKNRNPLEYNTDLLLGSEKNSNEKAVDSVVENESSKLLGEIEDKSFLSLPSATAFKKQQAETNQDTVLTLDPSAISSPQSTPFGIELQTHSRPYYQFGVRPSETEFLLRKVPEACKLSYRTLKDDTEQQAEILRRIMSVETGSQKSLRRFNVARIMEMIQKHELDTGSPQVQGIFSCCICSIVSI